MNKDLHKDLGPKLRVLSIEQALELARERYPLCSMEGSTGHERSFWITVRGRQKLIGHAWSVRGSSQFHFRLKGI